MKITLNDILNYSPEENIERDRKSFIRQCKRTQTLARRMEKQIKAEFVIDHKRLGRDATSCLRAFYTLAELSIRDLDGLKDGYNAENGKPPISDWFKKPRQHLVGGSQEGDIDDSRQDKPGQVGT